jgi:hypothetical protein
VSDVYYDANTNFSQYISTNTASDLSSSWPINVFVTLDPSAFVGLDLLAFLRYLYNSGTVSTDDYVVGAHIGFKAHSGHITYQFNDVGLSYANGNVTTVSDIMIIDPNNNNIIPDHFIPIPVPPTPIPIPTPTPTPIPIPIPTPTPTPNST